MEELGRFLLCITGVTGLSLSIVFFTICFYFILLSFLAGLGLFVLWIITLIDCIKRGNKDFAVGGQNAKLIWILLLILIRNIVPIIYFFLIMYKKPRSIQKP